MPGGTPTVTMPPMPEYFNDCKTKTKGAACKICDGKDQGCIDTGTAARPNTCKEMMMPDMTDPMKMTKSLMVRADDLVEG
jgi:hypothetical protein